MEDKKQHQNQWSSIITVVFWIVIVCVIVALFTRGNIQHESDCNSEQVYDTSAHKCVSKYNNVKDLETEIAAEKQAAVDKEVGRRNGTICIPASEAENYVGVDGCVVMVVQHVYWQAGNGFLNSEEKKPDFSVASFQNTLTRSDVEYYLGKKIEVRGYIKIYEGEPEIIINSKDAITIK